MIVCTHPLEVVLRHQLTSFSWICLTLIVDLNPDKSGLASVALSFTRCAGAAVQVAVLQLLLQSVGPGGTFTLFGMLSLVSIPMLWIVRAKGAKWRKQEADR